MNKIIAVTHNDRFHADDVFASAVLQLVFGEGLEIRRTRDEEEIKNADIVYDLGHIYDAETNRFDHHQKEGAGERDNGVPYASFGLVWKKWGEEIAGSKEAADLVDRVLVQPIDASDNGFTICEKIIENVSDYAPDRMFYAFGPTWKEEENYDEAFFEVLSFAKRILEREIILAKHKVEAIPLIEKSYEVSENKQVLVLEEYLPFGEFVKEKEEILFVISPSKDKKQWRINAIKKEGYINRKDLPSAWAGLVDGDLEKITGVEGSKFCHRKLFLAVANTKEAAIQLADLALKN